MDRSTNEKTTYLSWQLLPRNKCITFWELCLWDYLFRPLRLSFVAKLDVSFHIFTSKIPFLKSNRDIASKPLDGSICFLEKMLIQNCCIRPYCSHVYGQRNLFLYIARHGPSWYIHPCSSGYFSHYFFIFHTFLSRLRY